eukprot:3379020-Prymnesium_polylepis.1
MLAAECVLSVESPRERSRRGALEVRRRRRADPSNAVRRAVPTPAAAAAAAAAVRARQRGTLRSRREGGRSCAPERLCACVRHAARS